MLKNENPPVESRQNKSSPWLTILLACSVLVLAGVSSISHMGWLVLLALILATAGVVLFFLKPKWGLVVLLLELIWGGNGRWLELLGGAITPRYLLIIAMVLGYAAQKFVGRKPLPRLLSIKLLVAFGFVLTYGILQGVWAGNNQFLQDAQVWLYLVLALIIVDLWKKNGVPGNLVRLFLWSGTGIAIVQLALTVAANINPAAVFSVYPRLERMRILISPLQGTTIFYTFMGNSSLYGYVLAVSILLAVEGRSSRLSFSRRQLWLMAGLALLAALLSMTRGSWGQMAITLSLVAWDLLMRRKIPLRAMMALLLISGMITGLVMTNATWREAIVNRAVTLLPGNQDRLDPSDSVVVKAKEARQQLVAIADRPFFGYGFGQGSYADYGAALESIYFHNSYLQFALKTGVVGLLILLLLLVSSMWTAWRVGRLVQNQFPEHRALLHGMVYGLAGILVATTSNPHLTTPVFVAGFALMLALTDLVYRAWRHANC